MRADLNGGRGGESGNVGTGDGWRYGVRLEGCEGGVGYCRKGSERSGVGLGWGHCGLG